METNGGECIVKALKKEGVPVVFGLSGHGLVTFLEAIRKEEDIQFVSVRHEENAGHMADAWARGTGNVGVCCTTVGPGAANIVPGVAAAWADGSPVVVITVNNSRACTYPFWGSLEDIDSLSLFRPVTKWNSVVADRSRIPELTSRAFREAMMWSHTYLPSFKPRTRFFNAGMGHLGFGHPFANSLKMAFPDRQVVNVTGDGAFGFTLQELDTALRHGLKVVHVIHNDGAWGMCKFGQEILFGSADRLDQVFERTDYAQIAKGFGCYGETVEEPKEIKPALRRALDSGKPAVLDIKVRFIPHPSFQIMPAVVFQGCDVPRPPTAPP